MSRPALGRRLQAQPPQRPPMAVSAGAQLPSSDTVMLLVDFVNPLDFPGADEIAAPALEAAKAAARLKRELAQRHVVAVYANDNYGAWRCDFHELREQCEALPGIPGEMARVIAPNESDLTILKPRHSAFLGTPLDLLLAQMKTCKLVIAGLATDICVLLTAMDASLRGYMLWIPSDCTAAESPHHKQEALAYAERVLHADTRSSSDPAAVKEATASNDEPA